MIDTIVILFLVGVISFIGLFGLKFFERTKISDLLILLLIGLFLGPVFHIFSETEIGLLKSITPLFSAIALIILLFEGGLQLNFFKVIKSLKYSTIFTVTVFVLSLVLTTAIFYYAGWNVLQGLMMGAIVGGTSSAVVIPLIQRTSAKEETKTLLSLESSLTDALCVIVTIAFIELIQAKIIVGNVFSSIAAAFSIACVIGFLAGIIWLIYSRRTDQKYIDLLAIASLFLVYVVTEFLKGNGAVAALVFGIVLGNSKEITGMLRFGEIGLSASVKFYQHEIALLVRTFFFVYLGLIFEVRFLSNELVFLASAVVAALIIARIIGTRLLVFLNKNFSEDTLLIQTMMGRGLAAAVLSLMPLATKAVTVETGNQIVQIVFLVIIFSNIITTAGTFYAEKKNSRESQSAAEPPSVSMVRL